MEQQLMEQQHVEQQTSSAAAQHATAVPPLVSVSSAGAAGDAVAGREPSVAVLLLGALLFALASISRFMVFMSSWFCDNEESILFILS